jgi:hypothetical protein
VAHPCEELNLGFPMESRASLPLDDMGQATSPPFVTGHKKENTEDGGDGDRTRYGYRQQILNLPAFPIAYAPRKRRGWKEEKRMEGKGPSQESNLGHVRPRHVYCHCKTWATGRRRRKRSTATQSRTGVSAFVEPDAIRYTMAAISERRRCAVVVVGRCRWAGPKADGCGSDGNRTRSGFRPRILSPLA